MATTHSRRRRWVGRLVTGALALAVAATTAITASPAHAQNSTMTGAWTSGSPYCGYTQAILSESLSPPGRLVVTATMQAYTPLAGTGCSLAGPAQNPQSIAVRWYLWKWINGQWQVCTNIANSSSGTVAASTSASANSSSAVRSASGNWGYWVQAYNTNYVYNTEASYGCGRGYYILEALGYRYDNGEWRGGRVYSEVMAY